MVYAAFHATGPQFSILSFEGGMSAESLALQIPRLKDVVCKALIHNSVSSKKNPKARYVCSQVLYIT